MLKINENILHNPPKFQIGQYVMVNLKFKSVCIPDLDLAVDCQAEIIGIKRNPLTNDMRKPVLYLYELYFSLSRVIKGDFTEQELTACEKTKE